MSLFPFTLCLSVLIILLNRSHLLSYSLCPPIRESACLLFHLTACQSAYRPFFLHLCKKAPTVSLSASLSIYLPFFLHLCEKAPTVSLSASLSIYLPFFLHLCEKAPPVCLSACLSAYFPFSPFVSDRGPFDCLSQVILFRMMYHCTPYSNVVTPPPLSPSPCLSQSSAPLPIQLLTYPLPLVLPPLPPVITSPPAPLASPEL